MSPQSVLDGYASFSDGLIQHNLPNVGAILVPTSGEVKLEKHINYEVTGAWFLANSQRKDTEQENTPGEDCFEDCICFSVSNELKDGFKKNGFLPGIIQLQTQWQEKSEISNLLDEFIALDGAKPEKIRQFAMKWGPLWYNWPISQDGIDSFNKWYENTKFPNEPLSSWRQRITQVISVLNIYKKYFEDKQIVPKEKWILTGWPYIESYQGQIKILQDRLSNMYLNPCNGGPRIIYKNKNLNLTFGWGFFWPLWMQVAQTLTDTSGLYICSYCSKTYIRRGRKPKKGGKNCCPDCGKRGGYRPVKNTYDRKIRNQKED